MIKNIFIGILIILILLLIFFLVVPQKQPAIKQTKLIRIVNSGFILDGGSVYLSYFNEKNELISVFVYAGGRKSMSPQTSLLGNIYLNRKSDNFKEETPCTEYQAQFIKKQLMDWHDFYVEQYGFKNVREYSSFIYKSLLGKGIKLDKRHDYKLIEISNVGAALDLIVSGFRKKGIPLTAEDKKFIDYDGTYGIVAETNE